MANKWIPLDGKKEPEFNMHYLILDKSGNWTKGDLVEIKESKEGKVYEFHDLVTTENYTNITHYMILEPPKNNQ